MYWIFTILSFLFWPIVIIWLISFFINRSKKKEQNSSVGKYLQLAISREDAISQLFILLSILFFGMTLFGFNQNFDGIFSWEAILLITSIVALISAYYLKMFYTLIFGLVGVIVWWVSQAIEWVQTKDILVSSVFAGLIFITLLFYLIGRLHERKIKWKRFAFTYSAIGIIITTSILFFLSTKMGISSIGGATKGASILDSWQMTLSLFVLLVGFIGVVLYLNIKKLASGLELLALLSLAFLFSIIALLPQQAMFVQGTNSFFFNIGELSSVGVLWAIVFNFAVFLELLALIFSGYSRKETWLINLGAVFLFFFILVKYFDWFFTSLDKGIFFIGAGFLLFIVGWFMEKGRRVMLSNIKAQ